MLKHKLTGPYIGKETRDQMKALALGMTLITIMDTINPTQNLCLLARFGFWLGYATTVWLIYVAFRIRSHHKTPNNRILQAIPIAHSASSETSQDS